MLWLVFVGLGLLLIGVAAYSLVKASKGAVPKPGASSQRLGKRPVLYAAGAAAAGLLVGAAVLYSPLGSPLLSAKPDPSGVITASSAEELAKELKKAPTSAGYKRLANMHFMAGKYEESVAAYHRAIELGSDNSDTWSEFGESIVMASKGSVVPQALAAFTNAISRNPDDARARYYIGMAQAQIGNLSQAVAIWRDLEESAEPNAPWLPMVQQHVAAFSKQGGFDPKSVAPAAPSVAALRSAVAAMNGALDRSARPGAEPPPQTAAR
jgi:cytochrome c-type biogenesis protein CcmH